MSRLIVEVCAIDEIAPHSNADRLELARVKGWWCIVPKGKYTPGDRVVYVPPDSVLPEELAERWGIAKYCAPLGRGIDGVRPPGLRVRASRFRGERSFGTAQDLDDAAWPVGTDVREHYGITKYEPPVKASDGDAAPAIAAFHRYTDIENVANFPEVFADGEEVIVTEKIHGTNSRVGLVLHADDDGEPEWTWVAGSHGIRRKEFNDKGVRSRYWLPFAKNTADSDDPLKRLMMRVGDDLGAAASVIVFGEIFGAGVQDMGYGEAGPAFRAFDIAVDGRYLDYDEMIGLFRAEGVLTVPELYRGPFSMAKIDELVDGPTTVCDPGAVREAFKGREGVVIRPARERTTPVIGSDGRAVLKSISVDYHERKNKNRTEDH